MDEIEVVAHRDTEGFLRIVSIEHDGATQRVESTGRRWVDETGEHVLVMLQGGEVLHLVYKDEADRWFSIPRGRPSIRKT